jgi:DNA helicase II / ATP-dependent DNA helicase PcrA
MSAQPVLSADAAPGLAGLDRLNPEQREAACFGFRDPAGRFASGPLLVIAGAGTGKTATLAHRVAHLVLSGVAPESILLLTFSRRAALEMTRRAERLVAQALSERRRQPGSAAQAAAPAAVPLPWAGTFHAVGARLLRRHAAQLGLDPGFGILDRGDSADLLDVARHELGLSARDRRFPRKDTCIAIYSHRVNTGWPLEKVLADAFPWCADWAGELRTLFRLYVERKQANGVLDYDDLLLWWDAAMSDAALALEIGGRFEHVLVDEYQDTNALQARILMALKPDGRGLTVVGDDAQSIYSFRAADVGNILGFPERFEPVAHRVTLQTNYRSVQPVLDAANALIAEASRGHRKTLLASRGGGARPALVTVLDERAQADWVVAEVLRQREAGMALKRQAVLFRSAHHSDLLEVELTRRNIPYVKHGGLRFLEAAHVKDLLSVLRWADNPRNGIAGFRALQLLGGMGPAHSQRCLAHLAAAGRGGESPVAPSFAALAGFDPPTAARHEWPAFATLMAAVAGPDAAWPGQLEQVRSWYQPVLERRHDDAGVRAADLDMLVALGGQFASRERFLTELTLDPPAATGDLAGEPLRDEDWLVLSTVHSAKGQEWDAVYLLNVADGNFPNEYATGSDAAIEEERRLLYVAMTRARDSLQLVEPQRYHVTHQQRLGGTYVHGARSRFLTGPVLACLDRGGPPAAPAVAPPAGCGPRVDVAARLRSMW